ncbi:hypothetical protein COBT_000071 [Conglomerata obtusa]
MDEIIESTLALILRDAGYDSISKHALNHFSQIFKNQILSLLKALNALTLHAQRSKSSLIDIQSLLKLTNRSITTGDIQNAIQKNDLLPHFQNEIAEVTVSFENLIANSIDRFIHVYEFMPQFPPTHTFKRNYSKEVGKHRRPDGIKKRIEESVMVERSLIRMIMERGEMPKYVNYLCKK